MSDSFFQHIAPTSAYDTALPRPPTILLPFINPPTSTSTGALSPSPHPTEYIPLLTAYNINPTHLLLHPPPVDWTYSSRHAAQPLLPYLLLGPNSVARSADYLLSQHVTLALCFRTWTPTTTRSGPLTQAAALGIEAHYVDAPSPQHLVAAWPRLIRQINEHVGARLGPAASTNADWTCFANDNDNANANTTSVPSTASRRANVLLCCESGNQSSAATAVAYCIDLFGVDLVHAMSFVQSRRFCVALDEETKSVLQAHEGIVAARRAVLWEQARAAGVVGDGAAAGATGANGPGMKAHGQRVGKRGADDLGEGEVDMIHDDNCDGNLQGYGMVQGRGYAPFEDFAG